MSTHNTNELREKIKLYIAGLSESGDNFMKPEMVNEEVRETYLDSIMRVILQSQERAYKSGVRAGRLKALVERKNIIVQHPDIDDSIDDDVEYDDETSPQLTAIKDKESK